VGAEVSEADGGRYFCCDLTIRTGSRSVLEAAVRLKVKKYSEALSTHEHLALTVFGITHNGALGSGAEETFRRWVQHDKSHSQGKGGAN